MPTRLVLLFAVLAAAGCTCGSGRLAGKYGELVVVVPISGGEQLTREAVLPLPDVAMGARAVTPVTLRNVGDASLTVTGVTRLAGSEAVVVELPGPLALEPGGEATLDALFTPPQHADPTQATVEHRAVFEAAAAGTREGQERATIELVGRAVAADCYVPAAIDFGPALVRQRVVQALELRNDTAVDAVATVGAIGGGGAAFFSGPVPAQEALPPGGVLRVELAFQPLAEGAFSASVPVRRAGSCPEGVVALTGRGEDGALWWTPTSLDFTRLPVTEKARRAVTFVNGTRGGVGFANARVEGSPWFVLEGTAPTSVAPQGQAAFEVSCTPDALTRAAGSFVVDVLSDPVRTVRVPLACTGGGPRIRVVPTSLPFGPVPMSSSGAVATSRRLTVQNVGTPPASPTDATSNLFLGRAGLPPFVTVVPTNATTRASEVQVLLPPSYDPAVGIPAIAGRHFIDLDVRLLPASGGPKEADVVIYSNDAVEPALKVHLSATVAPGSQACLLLAEPLMLQFGDLPRGATRDLSVRLTNNSSGACLVSGLELAAGSDPAFSLPSPPPSSATLPSRTSLVVPVRVTVPGGRASGVLLQGALRFTTAGAQSLVAMSGRVIECLVATPAAQDFGTVRPGCRSGARPFYLYNACAVPIFVTDVRTTGAPFVITSAPALPAGGLSLTSAGTSLLVQTQYAPTAEGDHAGALEVAVIEAGIADTRSIPLTGRATALGVQVDTFTQAARMKADILFVVDDSCSMYEEQASLASNFGSFLSSAVTRGVQWQVGVTTTDMSATGPQGRLLSSTGNPALLTPAIPRVNDLFEAKVNVGVGGSGYEQPLAAATTALTEPMLGGANRGLVRSDATLAVIVVTDAVEQSPQPVAYYLNRLLSVKGWDKSWQFSFSAIGPFKTTLPPGCVYDSVADTGRYAQLVTATQGVQDDICTADWAKSLEELGKNAFGVRSSFPLGATPDTAAGLTVLVNGVPVTGWTYDPVTNTVSFPTPPTAGTTLTVSYTAACL